MVLDAEVKYLVNLSETQAENLALFRDNSQLEATLWQPNPFLEIVQTYDVLTLQELLGLIFLTEFELARVDRDDFIKF